MQLLLQYGKISLKIGKNMYILTAKENEYSDDFSAQVYVIGNIHRALAVGNRFIDDKKIPVVEISHKKNNAVIAVLKLAAREL